MKEKLFVISLDATVHEDVEYLMTKPNFSKIMAKRAEVERVRSVYPSLTYPAHVTLRTGCRPGKHGVYNNAAFTTHDDGIKHWHLYADLVRVEDLFTVAKRAGLTTAAVYWPVCGNHPHIDYLINEYFFPYEQEDTVEAYKRLGASDETMKLVEENLHLIDTLEKRTNAAQTDEFAKACTCSLIRKAQPDLMMVHISAPDTARHYKGLFSQGLYEAHDKMDAWLGDIVQAMEDAGVYENTNFVILSDHGQQEINQRVKLNVLLQRGGFIKMAPDGQVYSWKAFGQSLAMTCAVYLADPGDEKLYQEVYAYLQKLVDDGEWGFKHVYTNEELREKYGTYGAFSFMIATDGHTAVSDDMDEPPIAVPDPHDYRLALCTHGYEPELGPQPVFLAHGPSFKEGAVLPTANLMDIAPTLAKVFGLDMPQAEGRCMTELLK